MGGGRDAERSSRRSFLPGYLRIYGRPRKFSTKFRYFSPGPRYLLTSISWQIASRALRNIIAVHRGRAASPPLAPPSTRCLQRLIVFVRKFGKRLPFRSSFNATLFDFRRRSANFPYRRANFAVCYRRSRPRGAGGAGRGEKIGDSLSLRFATILADVIEKHANSELNKTDIKISFSKRQTCPTNATIPKYDGDQ